ncbi:hypothetical protein HCH_02853 [Hahella chejuensis KCTC 2396]|uniref:Uncharacterized protein n=1 Tax=Hahella chejuensis (strain KCTC 2396) TaxID=349521 RepID=Q2SI94_HAHCH|nr:hypothetical protein [Hahella chejuensis]ABC29630.1 hypothetical protein HCH_02853 [Hahella chejuensis KCTC 2396]
MKFSMNGFRRQLSGDVERLRKLSLSVIVAPDEYAIEEFVEALNEVIQKSNVLNCVYTEGDPDFTDMSDLEVEYIEPGEYA